jgi:hypothetical protein
VNDQGDLGNHVLEFVKDDPKIQRITKNLLDRAIGNKR